MKPTNFLLLATAAVSLLCFASPAGAVQPQLTGIDPPGVQRGRETELTFRGTRLEDAQQLLLYSPGVSVVSLTAEKGDLVKVKLNVAADCRLGFHAVRLVSATGISNLRLFSVGALTEVPEVEPNSDFASPQAIPLEVTVTGVVQAEDVDYYVVEAKQGERITAELEGMRLGNAFFDPYLAILNSERFELARSDDDALLRQDCFASIEAPADGKYIIQVRESSFGGGGDSKYRLHVGRFPRPTAVLPAGGKPGETLEVTWIGDIQGDRKQQITLPAELDQENGLFAQDERGIAPSANGIRLSDLPNAMEVEPNNMLAEATPVPAPGAYHGVLNEPGDVDHFKFHAKKGTRYDIRVFARDVLRSPLDSVLNVKRSQGQSVANNDDQGGPDSLLSFTAPEDDDYIVEIRDHLKGGSPKHAYRIEVAPIVPQLTMAIPEKVQYEATTVSVPRGNRAAIMVNARRQNFGGELNLNFVGLPAGMTVETLTMPGDRGEVPVVFSAPGDAPIGGTLVDLQGKPVDEKVALVGHLSQRTLLVRGQNNSDVYGHNGHRMAAAVTQEVPFSIEITPPKAPLVRDGSLELKVVAKRNADFKAPIALRLLYNPPGVGSSGSVSIPEGQTEASIPLTANGTAALGTWKIVVLATAPVGNGQVEVASQLTDLNIAEAYLKLAFQKSAVEKGQQTTLAVQIEKNRDFEGTGTIELLGLPAGAATEVQQFNKDSAEVLLPIKTETTTRPGRYQNLVCRVIIPEQGEAVTHTLGSGELRVDEPLPAPVAKVEPAPTPKPQPEAPKEPPKKVLSRLEQLRQAKEAGGK